MQKIEGDQACLVAATLTQAEMALRGAASAGSNRSDQLARRHMDFAAVVEAAYEDYLSLVTTGKRLPRES